MFEPIVTDTGICHSFNAVPTTSLLTPSYFTKSFEAAFNPDMSIGSKIVNGDGSGEQNAFEFYVFDKSELFEQDARADQKFSYYISLSSKDNYFDANSNAQEILPGYWLKWKVNAMEIDSNKEIKAVPIGTYVDIFDSKVCTSQST